MATIFTEKLFSHFAKDFRPHLSAVGLDESIFSDPSREIPVEKYIALIERVAAIDNPRIGLLMGQQIEADDLGVLGHAMLATTNIGEMLRTVSDYIYVFAQDNTVRLDVSDRYAVVKYRCLVPDNLQTQRDVEFATSGIARMVNIAAGRSVAPRYAEFEHPEPLYGSEYHAAFGCEARFMCSANRIHYDRRVLDIPSISSNARLFEALGFYLKHQLEYRGQDDDLVHKLKHVLAASFNTGNPELTVIASKLGIGERTLQRRLREKGIVFSDLVDQARKTVALEYVRGTSYRLTDIAQMLGYTEASSLTRACKRWTGLAPHRLRNIRNFGHKRTRHESDRQLQQTCCPADCNRNSANQGLT